MTRHRHMYYYYRWWVVLWMTTAVVRGHWEQDMRCEASCSPTNYKDHTIEIVSGSEGWQYGIDWRMYCHANWTSVVGNDPNVARAIMNSMEIHETSVCSIVVRPMAISSHFDRCCDMYSFHRFVSATYEHMALMTWDHFEAHQRAVQEYYKTRQATVAVDLTPDGWDEICEFLLSDQWRQFVWALLRGVHISVALMSVPRPILSRRVHWIAIVLSILIPVYGPVFNIPGVGEFLCGLFDEPPPAEPFHHALAYKHVHRSTMIRSSFLARRTSG